MPERSQTRSLVAGFGATVVLAGLIFFGSGNLSRFDPPLAAYAVATLIAAFGVTYRYTMWLQRPTTWQYFKTSWRLFLRPATLVGNLLKLAKLFWDNMVLQKFIERRSPHRWIAHMGIAWGCILAFMITLPLSWGWIQFLPAPNAVDYAVVVIGIPIITFSPHGVLGWFFFNWLNISAVLLLTGIGFALQRRMFHRGAQAVQEFASDLMPLFVLFSVAITGLMLTASERFMAGSHFSFISLLHAFTVVVLLLYLPFGKLFHVLQRPAQIGVAFYKEEGVKGPQALCTRSGTPYQSEMHHRDLVTAMKEVDLDFGEHQNLAPSEKIRVFALSQLSLLGDDGFVSSAP